MIQGPGNLSVPEIPALFWKGKEEILDNTHFDTNKFLDILDISAGLFGQIVVASCLGGGFLPSLHHMVHNLTVFKSAKICWPASIFR